MIVTSLMESVSDLFEVNVLNVSRVLVEPKIIEHIIELLLLQLISRISIMVLSVVVAENGKDN